MVPKKEEMRFCFQPRFLSFQESTAFLKSMVLITQKKGGLLFMHGGLHASNTVHIRQKWQEGENYWSNCCSVNCVLAWVGHNFSKEILKQQWFNWRCCWNYILYVLKFSSFWKTVENTIVICCNICQWNWMLSILRSIQKKYTIKKLL